MWGRCTKRLHSIKLLRTPNSSPVAHSQLLQRAAHLHCDTHRQRPMKPDAQELVWVKTMTKRCVVGFNIYSRVDRLLLLQNDGHMLRYSKTPTIRQINFPRSSLPILSVALYLLPLSQERILAVRQKYSTFVRLSVEAWPVWGPTRAKRKIQHDARQGRKSRCLWFCLQFIPWK